MSFRIASTYTYTIDSQIVKVSISSIDFLSFFRTIANVYFKYRKDNEVFSHYVGSMSGI